MYQAQTKQRKNKTELSNATKRELWREKQKRVYRFLQQKYQKPSKLLKRLLREKTRHPYMVPPEEERYRGMYQAMRLAIPFPKEDYSFDPTDPFRLPSLGDPMEEIQRILELEVSPHRKVNYLIAYLYTVRLTVGRASDEDLQGAVEDVYRCYRRVILRTIDYLQRCTLRRFSDLHPRITVIGEAKEVVEWVDELEKQGKIQPLQPHEIGELFAYASTKDAPAKPLSSAYVRKVRSIFRIREKPVSPPKVPPRLMNTRTYRE